MLYVAPLYILYSPQENLIMQQYTSYNLLLYSKMSQTVFNNIP